MTLALLAIMLLLGTFLAGIALAHISAGRPLVYGLCATACFLAGAAGIGSLNSPVASLILPIGQPWLGVHLRLDPLSAFFLIVIGVGGLGASLYGIGYGRHETDQGRVLPFFAAFLAAMNLVVLADDAFTFLFAWELMSLASWALVMAHHHEAETRHAAYVYLLMAGLSGLTLLLAFGLMGGSAGSYDFAAIRTAPTATGTAALILLLALVGAGGKAGLVPLHAWLPLAHPAAPSHVSALMSGVMTKVAIYGFIRIAFDLLGLPSRWTAAAVLLLGGVTAVLGILSAMMQTDLKKLLAYSTVENVGIVFIGIGLALAFRATGFNTGAAIALTAALFHVFNHMIFKSLLFFGAGAVLNTTGTRSLEQMGGLLHRMPKTGLAMLVGCAAISALPPLNGFVSEWLTFQAMLLRPDLPLGSLRLVIPVDAALLALAAALAAACFVKVFGIAFLGRPRSEAATRAQEVDPLSIGVMLTAATLCLLLGIMPGGLIDALAPVTQALLGQHMPQQIGLPWLSIVPIAEAHSSYDGLLVLLFLAVIVGPTAYCARRFGAGVRRAPAWDCGFPDPRPVTQYTAESFAQPVRRVFGAPLFASRETVTMPPPGSIAAAEIRKTVRDPIWEFFYLPPVRLVARVADAMNQLQFLTIRRYLAFVFGALVLLLLAQTLRL